MNLQTFNSPEEPKKEANKKPILIGIAVAEQPLDILHLQMEYIFQLGGNLVMMSGMYVVQRGQQYAIFTPQGIQVGYLFLGQDGQYAKDVATLGPITKALAKRWGVNPR